jgi:hypothetical protein
VNSRGKIEGDPSAQFPEIPKGFRPSTQGIRVFQRLWLTCGHPAVYAAIADTPRRRHVGPRPKACLLLVAKPREQGLLTGATGWTNRTGAGRAVPTRPPFCNEWRKCGANPTGVFAIDIDLIGLSVYGEVDSFVGVSSVNIVRQFDYYRFRHETIMAERNDVSEFQIKNINRLVPNASTIMESA